MVTTYPPVLLHFVSAVNESAKNLPQAYRPFHSRWRGFSATNADVALPNAGSIGLRERLGFRNTDTFLQVGFMLGAMVWRELLAPGSQSNSPTEPRRYLGIAS